MEYTVLDISIGPHECNCSIEQMLNYINIHTQKDNRTQITTRRSCTFNQMFFDDPM